MTIFKEINKFQNNNAIITEQMRPLITKLFQALLTKFVKINSRSLVFLVCGNNPEYIGLPLF